ncbi:tRNA pseudouridine(55) synthase TruB [Corynebacterium sp. P5848]|uniref:tRNA pseudouridine(55) synthase TruB n=1 Tax=Corynebacterium marambiense TaxID=2765364 RepID=UPI0022609D0A|nr:tRNA pseudouridine(55) synthase TruB [Corynebacterium marambiense]MCX7542663.1 tRNA pseudouridine(55) synthase TruB [Corynebacterium marambiense]
MTDPLATSGLVIVDKPVGLTSHDVIARLRRAFGTRKVGHAGTLDPMATGVLVVGIERGTRFLAHLVAETKSYTGTIRLGVSTSTDDADGKIVATAAAGAIAGLDDTTITAALENLRGPIMQKPSAVSAIKIDGKRAYERVRAGEAVDIPARPVTLHRLEVTDLRRDAEHVDIDIDVLCSSGTYIRSLARDLGAALSVGGHLTALRRTSVGPFDISRARPLAEIMDQPELSLSLDEALVASFPVLEITDGEGAALAMGKWLEPRGLEGVHAAVTPDGRAVALVKEGRKRLATVFVARPSTL